MPIGLGFCPVLLHSGAALPSLETCWGQLSVGSTLSSASTPPHKYCISPSSLSLSPFPSCTSIPWTIDVVSFQGNPIPRTKVKCRRLDANRTIGNPLSHASVVTGSCAPNTSSLLNNIMDQGRSTGAQQPDGLRERIVSPSDSTPGPDTLAAHGEAEIKDGDGKDKKTFGRTPDGTGRFDFISSVLILFHPVSFLS